MLLHSFLKEDKWTSMTIMIKDTLWLFTKGTSFLSHVSVILHKLRNRAAVSKNDLLSLD